MIFSWYDFDMQGKELGTTNLTADMPERIISASASKAGDKYFVTGTYSRSKKVALKVSSSLS